MSELPTRTALNGLRSPKSINCLGRGQFECGSIGSARPSLQAPNRCRPDQASACEQQGVRTLARKFREVLARLGHDSGEHGLLVR